MAERVHPLNHDNVVVSAPSKPTAPLGGQNSFRSENGDPEWQHQLPLARTIPYCPSKLKRCCTCKRSICWVLCLIFFLIVVAGILVVVVYFVFDPKAPKYSVNAMRIIQFNLSSDNSLLATFVVDVMARNPNKMIGIYYEGGNHLSVSYKGTELCQGSLPKFYQRHRNTTQLNLTLIGHTWDVVKLLESVQTEQQTTGKVLLNLRARAHVRLKLGKLKLMKWKFLVRCGLEVNSQLRADNTDIRISDKNCRFKLRL